MVCTKRRPFRLHYMVVWATSLEYTVLDGAPGFGFWRLQAASLPVGLSGSLVSALLYGHVLAIEKVGGFDAANNGTDEELAELAAMEALAGCEWKDEAVALIEKKKKKAGTGGCVVM